MRTTAEDHFQDVRLLSFDAEKLSWNPGDVVAIRPQNSDAQVEELFNLFSENRFPFNEKTVIRIEEIDAGKFVYAFVY